MSNDNTVWVVRNAGGVVLDARYTHAAANAAAEAIGLDNPGVETSVKEVHIDELPVSEKKDVLSSLMLSLAE